MSELGDARVTVRKIAANMTMSTEVAMECGLIEPSPEFLARRAELAKAAEEWAAAHCLDRFELYDDWAECELSKGHDSDHQAEIGYERTGRLTWSQA